MYCKTLNMDQMTIYTARSSYMESHTTDLSLCCDQATDRE